MRSYSLAALSLAFVLALSGCGAKKQHLAEVPAEPVRVHVPPPPTAWRPPVGDSIRHEMRAVWLTTAYGLDWPRTKADTPDGIRRQKQELERILDRLASDGYNTVFFQARLSGNTTYYSDSEPFSRVFTSSGERPDYDPLAFAIEACHRRGLALHAWIVTYPLASSRQRPHPIMQRNPSWAISHKGTRHLDPGLPEVRRYIAELSADIAKRYAVDGLHYDYFRYPEEAESFNDRVSYARYGNGQSREQWRRGNLTHQLEEIQVAVAEVAPHIQISVAPLGKLRKLPDLGRPHGWTAYESVHQDVETWAKRGLVDFVAPMMYYRDHLYEPFLIDWMATVGRYVPVVAGLAPYRVDPKEDKNPWAPEVIRDQINIARTHKAGGVSMFREANIGPAQPRLRMLIQDAFRHTALPLALRAGEPEKPGVPRDLKVSVSGKRLTLSWLMPPDTDEHTTYRVWATTTHPDGKRESELLVQGLQTTSCALRIADFAEGDCLELGVEAVNSYGVSTPCVLGVEFNLANHHATSALTESR